MLTILNLSDILSVVSIIEVQNSTSGSVLRFYGLHLKEIYEDKMLKI